MNKSHKTGGIGMYSIYEIEDLNGVDGGTLNLMHDAEVTNDFLIEITPEHEDNPVSVWVTKEQIAVINKLVNGY